MWRNLLIDDREKENNMKNHLPLLGAGPAYVVVVTAATIAAVILKCTNVIRYGNVPGFKILFYIGGSLLILLGILLWGLANFQCRISENIKRNKLVTTGIYAHVRNPILSGHLLADTGLLLFTCNLFLLMLPLVYWLYMTMLLRAAEEKWLAALYGEEYLRYCRKVNRCIPWF